MTPGTHNIGRNARGQLALARIDEDGVLLQVGADRIVLSNEQAQLLKKVLA